jgi:hypothetical protein
MPKKSKKTNLQKGYPIDNRPVIFNLIESTDVNFIGRYIESEGIFTLSLNDEESDFILKSEINEWWYIDKHPTVMKEVFSKKNIEKYKAKKQKKSKQKRKVDNSENKTDSTIPIVIPPSPFIKDVVEFIQQQIGLNIQSANVRVVDEADLPTLPNEVLNQLLEKAEIEENWELAIKVRDAIKSKPN